MKHGAQQKRCSIEGCTNRAQKGEVCKGSHGARGTEQRSNYAASKDDARIKLRKEEFV